MNLKVVINMLGRTLLCEAALMLLPFSVAIIYGERITGFLAAALFTAGIGFLCVLVRPKTKAIYAREGFLVVALSWILISTIGSLPFFIDRSIPNYIDALFETVSGFTTTGASILTDLNALNHADMFWRCFTHWIGGMGVLVFILAIMPSVSDEQPMYLMKAEVPGPTVGKLVSTIKKTAIILYCIYIGLTLLQVIFLLFGKMSLYDALIHTFSTAGTGGFSNRADSIGGYSPYIQYVIAIFMLIFATNFNIYYLILIKSFKSAFRDEEARWFYGITIISAILITLNVLPAFNDNLESAFRHSFFSVSSLISSTGFSSCDFNLWPEFSRTLLMINVLLGACAGSTGGGLKISRAVIIVKSLGNEIKHLLHPRSVNVITLNKKPVSSETLRSVYVFFAFEIVILFIGTLILSLDSFDTTTNFTASLSCFSNAGPGLNLVGPYGNYFMYSPISKLTLCLEMLLGRLEIFPIVVLFSPAVWKR